LTDDGAGSTDDGAGSTDDGAGSTDDFVDAHVHFWDHSVPGLSWPWLDPGFEHPRLKGMHRLDAPRFTPPELRAEAGGAAPAAVVHVHCAGPSEDPAAETAWLSRLADADDRGWPVAIVSASRLREPAGVAAMAANARHQRFRGVRDMSITGTVATDEVASAFDMAAELEASIELQLPHEHFATVRRLAERWPQVQLVLGHAGQPVARSPEYLVVWKAALHELAGSVPNVAIKVSGIASSADPTWTVDSIRPWVLGCIEAFGAERAMLATNWPIDRLHGRYPDLVAAYRAIIADLPAEDRAALLHGTAERVYRL
jgi:predicted TIM-barrel fold metal-dependent hydrolase